MGKWTKTGLLAFILIACFVFMAGCGGNDNPTGLSLTGTAERDFYSSFIGHSSMSEYYVTIVVANTGNPITFDAVRIFYDGGNNKGLVTTTIAMSEGKEPKEMTLNTGQTKTFESHTNGYTYDILRDSRAGKVALHVDFLRNGQVLDSFHAVLPSVIKWKEGSTELEYGKKVSLSFTRDYDAVMREVQK
jgi:hypothetical protein